MSPTEPMATLKRKATTSSTPQPSNEIRLLMGDMLDEADPLPPVEEESEAPPIKSAFEVDLLQPTEPTTLKRKATTSSTPQPTACEPPPEVRWRICLIE